MSDSGDNKNPLNKVSEMVKGSEEEQKAENISRREFGKLLGLGSAAGAGALMLSDSTSAITRVNPDFLSLDDGGDLRFGSDDDFELRYDSSSGQLELVGSSNVWSVSDGGSFNIENRDLDLGSGNITSLGGIDGSISPTWTNAHTWTSGTPADDIVLDPNDSDNGAPSLNLNGYARQLFVTPDGATDYSYIQFGAKDFTGINYYIYKDGDTSNVLTFQDNDGDNFIHLNSDHSPKQVIFYQETEFYNSDIFDSNSNQTIWDSSSGHIPLSALDGESGSSGQVLTTDGTTASWSSITAGASVSNNGALLLSSPEDINFKSSLNASDDGDSTVSVEVNASGIEADSFSGSNGSSGQFLQTDGSNVSWSDSPGKGVISLSTGHSYWGSGITNEEIERVNLQSGETLEVRRIEFMQKGGGSSTNASVDVYDATAGSAIGSQNLGGTTKNPGSSGQGNTVLFRISNSTGSDIQASVKIRYAIK